jgi:spore coat protein CotF
MQNQQQMGQQQSTGANQMQTPEMSDRDFINDILATEKYLTNSYNTAVNEASIEELYQLQIKHLTDTHQAGRELYKIMQQKGWYQIEPAESQKISQKATQFAGYSSQFPY